ncbi:MAG TPA: transketolase C-terminal domain-containing protein, partial [Bacteroidia bacterium]
SKERLQWETDFDCVKKMREWIEENSLASANELDELENQAIAFVNDCKKKAWEEYLAPIKKDMNDVIELLNAVDHPSAQEAIKDLKSVKDVIRKDIGMAINKVLIATIGQDTIGRSQLKSYLNSFIADNYERYSSNLFSESGSNINAIQEIKAEYNDDKVVDGREVVLACFDAALGRDPRVFAFGEDVGTIGDVNQGFAGMQEKYGELRVSDTGIRELSIIGQGIGAALRGLRPIAEIQYLDYLLYAIQIMSDDIATLQYRTKGGQKAPIIIRTRGHRLEGIWHSGSPMGMIIHAVRGMHVCVPRNMTQAAGMYNLLLKADEPALVIECLNGYRLKEKLPSNVGEFTVPLGKPEVLNEGTDVSIVSYGSTLRVIQDALKKLSDLGISCELIDVQTLLPFDVNHSIVESLKKTNKVVFIDEDVPGGATSYMMQQVLETQGGYRYLDAQPMTITAKAHRPAYGTDGDYFSKPNAEEIFMNIYNLMHEYNPEAYPAF